MKRAEKSAARSWRLRCGDDGAKLIVRHLVGMYKLTQDDKAELIILQQPPPRPLFATHRRKCFGDKKTAIRRETKKHGIDERV